MGCGTSKPKSKSNKNPDASVPTATKTSAATGADSTGTRTQENKTTPSTTTNKPTLQATTFAHENQNKVGYQQVQQPKKQQLQPEQLIVTSKVNNITDLRPEKVQIALAPKSKFTIAWCSWKNNNIMIYSNRLRDDNPIATHKSVHKLPECYDTLVKQIPQQANLISAGNYKGKAFFSVLNYKENMKQLFSFEVAEGAAIYDIASHAASARTALLSSESAKIAYHLFDSNSWKVLCKAPMHETQKGHVTGIDFSPSGEKIATMSIDNIFGVSPVNPGSQTFQLAFEGYTETRKRCRWNPQSSQVAVSYNYNQLNFVDVDKQVTTLKTPIRLHDKYIRWIEWRKDGTLLASCSSDRSVRVYDHREGKIVKIFENLHEGFINSVSWNSDGNLLMSTSIHGVVKVVDFKRDCEITYSGKTTDGEEANSCIFLEE